MSRHTAGPWSLAGTTVYALEHEGWRRGAEVFRNRFDARAQGPHCPPDELEANARLIAAAPDLLEALIAARAELAGLPHSLGYDFTHLPKIDAAIAAAEGETK